MNLANTVFVLKRWKKSEGNGKVLSAIITIVLKVFNSVFSVALASLVISIVMNTDNLNEAFYKILATVCIYAVSVTLANFFEVNYTLSLFLYRILELPNMFFKLIKLPFDQVEGPGGKREFEKAKEAVGSGNDIGIEALMKNVINLITYTLCLIGFALISARLSIWIMLVLLVSGYFRTFKDRKNRKYLSESLNERGKIYYEREYLRRKCLDTKIGKDTRIYRMEKWFDKKFEMVLDKQLHFRKQISLNTFVAESIHFVSGIGRDIICYGYLIYMISQGMPISDFVLYLSIIAGFNVWIKNIFDEYADYASNIIIVNNYRLYLDKEQLDQGHYEESVLDTKAYTYLFEDVCFSYENSKEIISNLNLEIKAGEKVALVGANGAGKTTLVKLMCGLYKPTTGRILINGVDISTIHPKELLRITGVVFQETKVFPDSIANNISCKDKEQTDLSKVQSSLRKADLYDFVNGLPNQEQTMLTKNMDDSGVEMSGGQYQKLMLARAIYKNAPVLILDEPTAALDPLAEEEMYIRYNEITKEKTSLFISHRLSSTQFCDRVIFLEDGHIKQDGKHDKLMEEEGPYRTMFDAQAHYYQEEVAV